MSTWIVTYYQNGRLLQKEIFSDAWNIVQQTQMNGIQPYEIISMVRKPEQA